MSDRAIEQNNAVCVLDQEGRVVYGNDAFFSTHPLLKPGMLWEDAGALKRGSEIEWPGAGKCRVFILDAAPSASRMELNKAQTFCRRVEALLKKADAPAYCMLSVDIERFRLLNEWYGREQGDQVLAGVAACLLRQARTGDAAAAYFGDDDFAVFLPMDLRRLKALQAEISEAVRSVRSSALFMPSFGAYACKDRNTPPMVMYERAVLAMSTVKGSCTKRLCWYDESMLRRDEEYGLLSEVRQALENREFTFYIQPQFNLYSGKVVGAEALVRWEHQTKGLLLPGEFIPFMERTGFVADLDCYIWEQVCIRLHDWIRQGKRPVPIAVNLSRVDFYAMDVAQTLLRLKDRYQIPSGLLEAEITESVYVGDYLYISETVSQLRAAGIPVLMDDFGSGYSSLNMLKSMDLDALKIDAKFLEMTEENAGRGEDIIEAVIHMARLMNLSIVVEGLEKREQLEFLQDLGCRYAQGFYFSPPLSIEDFEAYIGSGKELDPDGFRAYRASSLHLQELLSQRLISENMLNSLIGPMAVYDVCGDQIEIAQANGLYDQMVERLAGSGEYYRRGALDWFQGEDLDALTSLFRRARQRPFKGLEDDVRCVPSNGREVWFRLRLVFLQEQKGHATFYGTMRDVTDQHRQEALLESAQRSLAIAAGDESFLRLTEENRRIAESISAQMTMGGMIGGYCEEGFPLYFANAEMVRFLGYDSYESFNKGIGGLVINTIHPDDRRRVAEDIGPRYFVGLEYVTVYRMPKSDGTWIWTIDRGQVIRAEDGRLAIVSACTDISDVMAAQQQLAQSNADLLRRNRELQFFTGDMPGCYHRCADTPEFDFLYISELFLQLFDYTREEIEERFGNKFLNMVHPDDRARVISGTGEMRNNAGVVMEYRMRAKHGYIWVVDQSRQVTYEGQSFYHGVVIDVTETVELRDRMKLLMRYAPNNITLCVLQDGGCRFQTISDGLVERVKAENRMSSQSENAMRRKLRERMEENIRALMDRGEGYRETIPIDEGDRTFWLSVDAGLVRQEGEQTVYLCILRDVTDMKAQESRLRLISQRLESTLRLAHINSWDWDIERDTLSVLDAGRVGWAAGLEHQMVNGELVIPRFTEQLRDAALFAAGYTDRVTALVRGIREGRSMDGAALDLPVWSGGHTVWVRIAYECVTDGAGVPVRAIGYYTDITEEKLRSRASQETIQVLELLGGPAVLDLQAELTGDLLQSANGCLYDAGASYSEAVRRIAREGVAEPDREAFLRFTDRERLVQLALHEGKLESLDYRSGSGEPLVWMRAMVYLLCSEDRQQVRAHLFLINIDAQKRQELRLTQMAETDALTGLYNRHRAIPEIREYLAHRPEGERAALIMLDLDNFKRVNDVYGHAYGDALISNMAGRIRRCFRESDIVCRYGGDEFLVLCKGIEQKNIQRKLRSVVRSVTVAYDAKGGEFRTSASAGYVMIPDQGEDFEELCARADTAMFSAKLKGKNTFCQYEPGMSRVRHEMDDRQDRP